MDEKIIFNGEFGVSVMTPYLPSGLSALEIAMKDVPPGVPFWIVKVDKLPVNVPQEAWVIDPSSMPEPDGYGGTYKPKDEVKDDQG